MAILLDTRSAPGSLFRVGRKTTVWQWVDPTIAGGGGRWDAPDNSYAVLYASGSPVGAYVEKLSALKPKLQTVEELKKIRRAPRLPATHVGDPLPLGWRDRYVLSSGIPNSLTGPFIAVGGMQSLSTLRWELAQVAQDLGIKDIDAGVIRVDYSDEFRRFTQAISQFLFDKTDDIGAFYAGIFYSGQHGDDIENYAIFQRSPDCPVAETGQSEIDIDDPDFLRACELLSIHPT